MGRTESVLPGMTKAEDVADAAVSFADVPVGDDTAEFAAETSLAKAPVTEAPAAAEPVVDAASAASVAAVAAERGASLTMGPSSVTAPPEVDVDPAVSDVVVLEVVELVPESAPELLPDEVPVPLLVEVFDAPSAEVVPVVPVSEVPPSLEVVEDVVDEMSCPLTLIWQF